MVNNEVKEFIASCHHPNDAFGEYICLWRPNKNSKFTIKAAYKSIVSYDSSQDVKGWKEVWDNHLPHRIKHLLWLIKHRKILTNCEMVRRRLIDAAGCILCGNVQETVLHDLRDCQIVVEAWRRSTPISYELKFFGVNLDY